MKEKFVELARAIGASELAGKVLPMLEHNLESLVDYVKAVYMLEVSIQLITARTFDAREAAEKIAEKDRQRRVMHEAAIAAVSSCNRMAERFGVAPVFDGNIEDRYEVADFCGAFVNEVFESATSASYSTQPIIDRLLKS